MKPAKRLSSWLRLRNILPGLSLLLVLAACSQERSSFLDPGGPIAAAQREHLISVVLWTMIAIIPVFVLVPLLLWRYRYKNKKARYDPKWEFSLGLDILMWGVPVLIVAVLSNQLYNSTHKLDPYKPIESAETSLKVQVVGLDWKWLFIYPELGIASVNELAFPTNTSVAMDLTTDTIMQSFMISALAGQMYAMPGMRTKLHVLADEVGSFEGENTQYSGDGFTEQKFQARAMTAEDFDAWVAKVKADGVPLDQISYGQLAVASTGAEAHNTLGTAQMPDGVIYYSDVEPELFRVVLHRYMQGAPVPAVMQPGAPSYIPPATPTGVSQ